MTDQEVCDGDNSDWELSREQAALIEARPDGWSMLERIVVERGIAGVMLTVAEWEGEAAVGRVEPGLRGGGDGARKERQYVWRREDEDARTVLHITGTTTGDELRKMVKDEPETCARVAFAALARSRSPGIGSLDRLLSATVALEALDVFRGRLVDQARAGGASWAAVAEALDISRQAATERFGRRR